jgi:hypothetical protein
VFLFISAYFGRARGLERYDLDGYQCHTQLTSRSLPGVELEVGGGGIQIKF